MTWILGISAYYHDSAIALLCDGVLQFAASEERFSRKKHDASFPLLALRAGLEHCRLRVEDLDYVGFYEKPWLKFERLLETYLAVAPRGYRSFATAIPAWLNKKLYQRNDIRRQLATCGGKYSKRIIFCEHHQSHAASAFFPSPFDEAAILTVDGVGEWATTCWGSGQANRLSLQQEIRFPHSLGLFYSTFTHYCGFRVNSGEYKLMGLAARGRPVYAELLRDQVIHFKPDGSFFLNMEYFGYCHGLSMATPRLQRALGFPPRHPESALRPQDCDLAASVQLVLEDAIVGLGRYVRERTGSPRLCMAGGVALNCRANTRLLKDGVFDELWIQPAAGDAGGALGVAELIWHQLLKRPRIVLRPDAQAGSLLGTAISNRELDELQQLGAVAQQPDEEELIERAARMLASGAVLGWVQGRMEFGPRALGCRSILADPRDPGMQEKLNAKIKRREGFRPFAPAVPEEDAERFFDLPRSQSSLQQSQSSRYMLHTFPVLDRGDQPAASSLPAITHVDGTARVQTVSAAEHPRFHRLLKRFGQLTGVPVLINTSLNVRGEPLVRTAAEAFQCFAATEMDALVMEQRLYLKEDQTHEVLNRLAQRELPLELD